MKENANTYRKSSIKDRCNRLKVIAFKRIRDVANGSLQLSEGAVMANYLICKLAESEGDHHETDL